MRHKHHVLGNILSESFLSVVDHWYSNIIVHKDHREIYFLKCGSQDHIPRFKFTMSAKMVWNLSLNKCCQWWDAMVQWELWKPHCVDRRPYFMHGKPRSWKRSHARALAGTPLRSVTFPLCCHLFQGSLFWFVFWGDMALYEDNFK